MSEELDSDNTVEASDALQLSSTEVRILGCLIEKQATHPETYPLTLNALVLACNQKTSREPVMNLTPGQVGQSLRALESLQLTRLVMGSRAVRATPLRARHRAGTSARRRAGRRGLFRSAPTGGQRA